jgi:hypothetical protein
MDISSEHRTKSVPPEPKRFMANINATLMQQILDVAKGKRKPDVHHHSKADDFRAGFEVTGWVAFCHPERLADCPARLKPI